MVDTKYGDYRIVDPKEIHQLPISHTEEKLDWNELSPLIFHERTLANFSENQLGIHILEMERFANWRDKSMLETHGKASELGVLPIGFKETVSSYFWSWVEVIKERWMFICSLYVSFLIVRDLILPLSITYVISPVLAAMRPTWPTLPWRRPTRRYDVVELQRTGNQEDRESEPRSRIRFSDGL